jgi:hypothetical protein
LKKFIIEKKKKYWWNKSEYFFDAPDVYTTDIKVAIRFAPGYLPSLCNDQQWKEVEVDKTWPELTR